ncbi:MAG: sulfotransferase family protein [Egibacteraceae bacterium]
MSHGEDDAHGPLVPSPVFIFSPVRAGSTLLRCVLGSNSHIHAPQELHLTGLTVHTSDMLTRRALDTLGMTTRDLEHFLWDHLLHHELVRSGKQVLVEKTPEHVLSWRRIAEYWPAARYIFLIRHPVHIAASLSQIFEEPVAITEVLKYAHAMDEARAELAGPTVRYEDLTTHPEEVISQLCTFLDVPWEPEMLDYGRFDHGPFDHGPFAPGLGDWSENIHSGRIQPPRPMSTKIPEALEPCCTSWGYLESSIQPSRCDFPETMTGRS